MAKSPLLEEQRENWGSRAGFILAAIGSAVGLGNLWGFPYKLYKYGGGAFLIPYIVAMVIIGVPVLILEFSIGHMTQRAAPDAFGGLGRKKEAVGWWGILLGFVIITYYPVILAWCLSFLWYSIEGVIWHDGVLPWAGVGADGVKQTSEFFLNKYCNIWTEGEGVRPWALGTIQPQIAYCLVGVWVLMFLCIFRGVRIVSKVVMWTVPLPWLMLLILTVRGLTLEGADSGLAYYLNPDWAQLLKPTTWRFAFGQVFFSMSLAFGVMITYASFLHRKSDINNNATIIGLGDLGTSFVAGIAVFSTLGAMSVAANVRVDGVIGEGTVGLAFIAFPYALAQLPLSAWFGIVFFVALITLGIDSAFSITESVLASIVDKTGWNRKATLWAMTFVGLVSGLIYCSRGGLSWLEHIDGFINGPWGIALLGLLECVVVGWMYRIARLREHANERSDWRLGAWWDWNIRIVVPVVLSALFIWSLYDTATAPDGYLFDKAGVLNLPTLVGLVLAGLAPIMAVILASVRSRLGGPVAEIRDREMSLPKAATGGADIAGGLLGLAGFVLVIIAGVATIVTKCTEKLPAESDGLLSAAGGIMWILVILGVAIVFSLIATVLGSAGVVRAEKRGRRAANAGQIAGGFGTITFGMSGGLVMALWSLLAGGLDKQIEHTTEMSTPAYAILAVMLALIVGGIGWCFYRAIRAAGGAAPQQLPDDGKASGDNSGPAATPPA